MTTVDSCQGVVFAVCSIPQSYLHLDYGNAGAFDLILDQLSLPAEDLQAADGVQCLLDSEATSSDSLSSLSRTDLVEQLWCLQSGIIADDHCPARHRIYFWKMLLRDDLSDELDEPEIILQPAGDAVIDDVTLYCRLDISHQPDCLSSWERLAGQLLMRTRPWMACKLVSKADASCHPLVVGSCFRHA